MALFERPPLETLSPAKDRWTPLYLEHGRLEVDDSSVKWIASDGLLCRLPVATVSALILGPGTTVTHAAIKACEDACANAGRACNIHRNQQQANNAANVLHAPPPNNAANVLHAPPPNNAANVLRLWADDQEEDPRL